MYALEMLLVSWGILAFRRALESPTRRAPRAVRRDRRAAALHAVLGALPAARRRRCCSSALAWRERVPRTRRAGCCSRWRSPALAFVPWLPTFLYQRAHTGTPWGTAQFPGVPFGYTLRDFAGGDEQEGWLLLVSLIGLLLARPVRPRDRRAPHRDRPPHAARRALGGASSAARRSWSRSRSTISRAARSSRGTARWCSRSSSWSSARGITTLADPRVRAGVLVVVRRPRVRRRGAQRVHRTAPRPGKVAARAARRRRARRPRGVLPRSARPRRAPPRCRRISIR